MKKLKVNQEQVEKLKELDSLLLFIKNSPRDYCTLAEVDQQIYSDNIHIFTDTKNHNNVKNLEYLVDDGFITYEPSKSKDSRDKYFLSTKGYLKVNGVSFEDEYKNSIYLQNLNTSVQKGNWFKTYWYIGVSLLSFIVSILSLLCSTGWLKCS